LKIWGGSISMFITLSDIKNGECVLLNPVIDNRDRSYQIALSEILYYPDWVNISGDNNYFNYGTQKCFVPSGYYDVCSLNSTAFLPRGLELKLNQATGKLSIHNITKPFDLGSLGPTLGFLALAPPVVGGIATAESFSKLHVHKELFIHLDSGLTTTQNRLNHLPSTILRAIPVKTEERGEGRAVTFIRPLFKWLENGTLDSIQISVRSKDNKLVDLSYLSCVLEIKY
jgi:hypothetical protein